MVRKTLTNTLNYVQWFTSLQMPATHLSPSWRHLFDLGGAVNQGRPQTEWLITQLQYICDRSGAVHNNMPLHITDPHWWDLCRFSWPDNPPQPGRSLIINSGQESGHFFRIELGSSFSWSKVWNSVRVTINRVPTHL